MQENSEIPQTYGLLPASQQEDVEPMDIQPPSRSFNSVQPIAQKKIPVKSLDQELDDLSMQLDSLGRRNRQLQQKVNTTITIRKCRRAHPLRYLYKHTSNSVSILSVTSAENKKATLVLMSFGDVCDAIIISAGYVRDIRKINVLSIIRLDTSKNIRAQTLVISVVVAGFKADIDANATLICAKNATKNETNKQKLQRKSNSYPRKSSNLNWQQAFLFKRLIARHNELHNTKIKYKFIEICNFWVFLFLKTHLKKLNRSYKIPFDAYESYSMSINLIKYQPICQKSYLLYSE